MWSLEVSWLNKEMDEVYSKVTYCMQSHNISSAHGMFLIA